MSRAHRSWVMKAVALGAAAVMLLPAGSAVASSGAHDGADQQPVAEVSREAPTGVVALGDSYSSGLGTEAYEDDCDRTQQAWVWLIFADDVPASERTLLACSGAVIDDVYDQVDELEAVSGAGGRLITVTVGGNDVGFANELANCFVPFVSCTNREDAIMAEINALANPLTELYLAVQSAAPGDELIVGGYPFLVPDPDVRSSCSALTPLLSSPERQMIRRLGSALNEVTEEAASAAGVRSAGTQLEQVFDGHEACANGPDDWLNGLKLGRSSGVDNTSAGEQATEAASDDPDDPEFEPYWDIISDFVRDSFHPNAAGQAGYADAFASVWGSS
ncbi:GDSL-type esterase/lipase family protein [Phytoactinopolyspora endophytica]|uniref:GDSL-type esterase/lipase family protein n=1 Tax=Phytoactinopolyspora endophytica TaxID=1642495 RepID=UPI00101C8711|nr:GDSL-type esterase/lipase family protein [Phytoactinopolyspora endophytica]